jgi:glycosyltransferase involved in cell wall biosynthesis
MKISVIIAAYNGASTIQQCIESVANQTYPHKELIIMDGASKDATVSILERNTSQIEYWESREDRGIAHAWNKALKHATGDWVIFLGADDRFHDECVLSDMADVLHNDTVHDVVYGQIIFEGGPVHGMVMGGISDLSALKRKMIIPHTAAFQRRTYFDEVGLFDETFKIAIDYEILLRKKQLSALFVNRRIAVMGGEGISTRLVMKTLREFRMAQLKNKVDWRFKIEAWHAFYQLRHQFNTWRNREPKYD